MQDGKFKVSVVGAGRVGIAADDYRGVKGVALSVPCLLGRDGVEEILGVDLSSKEEEKFREAVKEIKEFMS